MQRSVISELWGLADERLTVGLRIYFDVLDRRGHRSPSCSQATSQVATFSVTLLLSVPRSSSLGLPLMERTTPEKHTCSDPKLAFRSPTLQFPKRRSPRLSPRLKFPSPRLFRLLLPRNLRRPKLQSLQRSLLPLPRNLRRPKLRSPQLRSPRRQPCHLLHNRRSPQRCRRSLNPQSRRRRQASRRRGPPHL